ncbi:DUF975 family protein [Clostridium ganghwense]|uniref:DUF975 family protein n=1 Tax=Clostridium ganghwense TaxID=312089 RepID=A0ABT4CLD7_9CLOT|nr:DUF975 family protein [Clostridium ganghwense]MCY6369860.1 DUF975 family protein [Clostridium ganghwense]
MSDIVLVKKSINELKKHAIQNLKGKWGISVLVCFIATLFTGIFTFAANVSNLLYFISQRAYSSVNIWQTIAERTAIAGILSRIGFLVNLLIGGCIAYGIYRFFLNLITNNNPKIENLFLGFKFFGKNFLIQLIIIIFTFLWTIVVYIPAAILIAIVIIISGLNPMHYSYTSPISFSIVTGLLVAVILITSFIIIYIITARYAMSFFIFNDNPEFDVMQCIKLSKKMMDGYKIRYFLLNLSFVGWDILATIPLGIGHLWLKPYKYATRASFYIDLKGEEEIKNVNIGEIIYSENNELHEK